MKTLRYCRHLSARPSAASWIVVAALALIITLIGSVGAEAPNAMPDTLKASTDTKSAETPSAAPRQSELPEASAPRPPQAQRVKTPSESVRDRDAIAPEGDMRQAPSGVRITPPDRRYPPSTVRIESSIMHRPFHISIWTDRSVYRDGDPIRIYFRSSRDAHVYIFDTDTEGVTRQIFPNYFDRDNFVRAMATYTIPDARYSLMVTGPGGRERLEIVAVSRRLSALRRYEVFDNPADPYPMSREGAQGLLRAAQSEAAVEAESSFDESPADIQTSPDKEPNAQPGAEEGPTAPHAPRDRGQSVETETRPAPSRIAVGPSRVVPAPPRRRIEPIQTAWNETSFQVQAAPRRRYDDPGFLHISSSPRGARIYVDGDYLGLTPRTVELSPGFHEVELEKDGYYVESTTVRILSGRRATLSLRLYPVRERGW